MTESETLAGPRHSRGTNGPSWLWHPAVLAVGGFLIIRAIGILVLYVSPERGSDSLIDVLGIWDGGWYVRIAEQGYADHLDLSSPGTDQTTGSLAFFPVYPMLMRVVSAMTGLSTAWAGVVISLVAGAVAAAGIAVLVRDWAGPRAGVLAALLWAATPMAVVSSLVYTEALFTALTVWAFVALRRHSWLLAGALAAAAGLTRPTGIAVGAAVAGYAMWTWWHTRATPNNAGVRPLVAAALALAGTPAFWLWVATRSGRWDGWFAVQKAFWGSYFDGGASIAQLFKDVAQSGLPPPPIGVVYASVAAALLVALALLLFAIRDRVWWPLLIYAAISLVMVIGSAGYYSSKLRFLVPIFVLLFPIARWLADRSRPTQVIVVLAAVAGTTFTGTWLLVTWPYAI